MIVKYHIHELKDLQLETIAKTHLAMPIEWGGPSDDCQSARQELYTRWRRSVDEPDILLVAFVQNDNEMVLAFLWAEIRKEPERHVHICSLWVDPAHRGQGFARMLMTDLESWARRSGSIWIQSYVHIRNQAMRLFNNKLGYIDSYVRQIKILDE